MTNDPVHILFEELRPFKVKVKGAKPSVEISTYLREELEKSGAHEGKVVTMPSLMKLAQFFGVSHMEVHDALQHLRQQGYDYNLKGMDAAIPFWYTAICDETSRHFGC